MSPVFSAMSPICQEDRAPHHIELQLVPDEELMDIWEQTQRAAYMLEEKGWNPATALHYCDVLVWEMQLRLTRLPVGRHFGSGRKAEPETTDLPEAAPRIVTVRI